MALVRYLARLCSKLMSYCYSVHVPVYMLAYMTVCRCAACVFSYNPLSRWPVQDLC